MGLLLSTPPSHGSLSPAFPASVSPAVTVTEILQHEPTHSHLPPKRCLAGNSGDERFHVAAVHCRPKIMSFLLAIKNYKKAPFFRGEEKISHQADDSWGVGKVFATLTEGLVWRMEPAGMAPCIMLLHMLGGAETGWMMLFGLFDASVDVSSPVAQAV